MDNNFAHKENGTLLTLSADTICTMLLCLYGDSRALGDMGQRNLVLMLLILTLIRVSFCPANQTFDFLPFEVRSPFKIGFVWWGAHQVFVESPQRFFFFDLECVG